MALTDAKSERLPRVHLVQRAEKRPEMSCESICRRDREAVDRLTLPAGRSLVHDEPTIRPVHRSDHSDPRHDVPEQPAERWVQRLLDGNLRGIDPGPRE